MLFMEKVILPVQKFFRCISEVSKLVLGRIIPVICSLSLFLMRHLFKRKKCSAAEDLTQEP